MLDITTYDINEDTGVVVMSRLKNISDDFITIGSINNIKLTITDNGKEIVNEDVGKVSSVFDTLQTDSKWTVDNIGYNFSHTINDNIFTEPFHIYAVRYRFTPHEGSKFWLALNIKPQRIRY